MSETPQIIRTLCHPEANGRVPQIGDEAYNLDFVGEKGNQLVVQMGKSGFETVSGLLLDMMTKAPPHDDGSTTVAPYWKLKARCESAELRCRTLETENAALVAQVTVLTARLVATTNALSELIKGEHDDSSVGITGWDSLHELVAANRDMMTGDAKPDWRVSEVDDYHWFLQYGQKWLQDRGNSRVDEVGPSDIHDARMEHAARALSAPQPAKGVSG